MSGFMGAYVGQVGARVDGISQQKAGHLRTGVTGWAICYFK